MSARAQLKSVDLLDYRSAINDYLLLLKILETDNKISIAEHNKWLARQKLSANHKSITGIRPVFEEMISIADCYIKLNDPKNGLIWLDKALSAIDLYKTIYE